MYCVESFILKKKKTCCWSSFSGWIMWCYHCFQMTSNTFFNTTLQALVVTGSDTGWPNQSGFDGEIFSGGVNWVITKWSVMVTSEPGPESKLSLQSVSHWHTGGNWVQLGSASGSIRGVDIDCGRCEGQRFLTGTLYGSGTKPGENRICWTQVTHTHTHTHTHIYQHWHYFPFTHAHTNMHFDTWVCSVYVGQTANTFSFALMLHLCSCARVYSL